MPRHTLVHQLEDWALRTPASVALRHKSADRWVERTWAEYWHDVRRAAKGLLLLGQTPGACVAIVGDNRMEWVILELAIMACGAIPAPIYTTSTPEQVAHILQNSDARIAVCDGAEQLAKLRAAASLRGRPIDTFVSMDALADAGDLVSFAGLLERGDAAPDTELEARIAALSPEDTALLIYTSGTTGRAKGVELDHGGLVAMTGAVLRVLSMFDPANPNRAPYRTLSYLPLCHGAEQLLTTMGHLETGGTVSFCPELKQLRAYLLDVRPTVFLGVPRVWEKFEAALAAHLDAMRGFQGALVGWARRTELDAMREELATGRPAGGLRRTIARRLALDPVRRSLGLDALQYAITGSAPIGVSTLEFFASLGIVVHEAYGMSETSGVCTVTPPRRPRFGRVGRAIDGVDIRVAGDGEVLLRGRPMTRGYFRMPDETAALYADGWLRTGDIGDVDADGYLAITGRKKELLITAGGKNVAPVELEAYLQQIPGVAQAVVVGDRRPYLAALLTLDLEYLPTLARALGCPADVAGAARHPGVRAYLDEHVESFCNARVARYQTIKRVHVLPVELTVDNGALTPTMKLRRKEIHETFAAEIAALFDAPGEP